MTFDVISTSPCVSQGNTRHLEGESSSLSEVTKGFFPGDPSNMRMLKEAAVIYFKTIEFGI